MDWSHSIPAAQLQKPAIDAEEAAVSDKQAPVSEQYASLAFIMAERARRGLSSHKALLLQTQGCPEPLPVELDLEKLTAAQRQLVLDAALKTQDMDNMLLLSKIQQRLSRVGMHPPENEVRFEQVCVEAEAVPAQSALPSIPGWYLDGLQGWLKALHLLPATQQRLHILKGVSGVVRASRLTLLLGPPGSGRSTLLKALAGRLRSRKLQQRGSITYNGRPLTKFVVERTSSYVDQHDNHIADLTVRETLGFAARCLNAGLGADSMLELRRREKEAGLEPDWEIDAFMRASTLANRSQHIMTDYMLRLLGLEVCADVPVGSAMVRGISGGQRKRTTIGEMVIGPKRTLFMDEISTGLDASTTLQIVRCMRNLVVLRQCTIMMALLQPAPETFELFDDVMLLASGRMVYQGPREDIQAFFESQAFLCPPRKGMADFLQEICSPKDQEQFWADNSRPWSFVAPEALAEAFQHSSWGQQQIALLKQPYQCSIQGDAALVQQRYALGGWSSVRALFRREAVLMYRHRLIYALRFVQLFTLAFMSATLFVKTRMSRDSVAEGQRYVNYLFFASFFMVVNGFSELPITVQSLSVFYKQRDELFYPVYAYLLPLLFLRIPLSLIVAILWNAITYFSIGLTLSAGRFFIQLVTALLLHQVSMAVFRAVGAIARQAVAANALGFLLITAAILFNGFIIARGDLPSWWIWALWANPGSWGFRSFAIAECLSPLWQAPLPTPGQTTGEAVLEAFGMLYPFWWIWIDLGALVCMVIAWNGVAYAAMLFLGEPNQRKAVLSQDSATGSAVYAEDALRQPSTAQHVTLDLATSHPHRSHEQRPSVCLHAHSDVHPEGPAQSNLAHCDPQHVQPPGQRSLSSGSHAAGEEAPAVAAPPSMQPGQQHGAAHMSLPFQPMTLTFQDVHYYVPSTAAQRQAQPQSRHSGSMYGKQQHLDAEPHAPLKEIELLKGISGAFCPGVLTALMGASGAGKTTLLDVLACRKTYGRSTGVVQVNGFPQNADTFARISGYVEQEDIHSPQATVHEALLFSGRLRQPSSTDFATLQRFVAEIMDLVELTELRGSLVGLQSISGLSVEQRKRLSIAVELVANPAIVFMDEPTSGLDARAAAIVVRTLRRISETGRTITATVHQPATEVFESFDELMLLERGGRTVYAGLLGHQSSNMIAYFEGVPGVPRIAPGYNPATYMLDISTISAELGRKQCLADAWQGSHLCRQHLDKVQALSQPQPGAQALQFRRKHAQSLLQQYLIILAKNYICYWRYPQYNAVRLTTTVILAIIFGSVYWQKGLDRTSEQGVKRIAAMQFIAVINMGFNNAFTVQPILAVERGVFYRERAAFYYSSIPYALAQGDVEIPFLIFQSVLYSLIVYFMVHLEQTAVKFFDFLFFMFLTLTAYTTMGIGMLAVTPSASAASVSSVTILAAWVLFAGFVAPRPTIPGYWIWFYWISPTAHALYGLTASQHGDVDDEYLISEEGLKVSVATFVRQYFGFEHCFLGYAALVLCGFIIVFRVAAVLALRYINWQKR